MAPREDGVLRVSQGGPRRGARSPRPNHAFSTVSQKGLDAAHDAGQHGDMRDQRGLNNGVQVTLLFPLAFGILLLTLQWAMVSWAGSSALAAAQDGARVAAAINGSASAGESAAKEAAGNGSLNAVEVSVNRGATRTSVSVSGSAPSVIPGVHPLVRKTAEVPTERLTRP